VCLVFIGLEMSFNVKEMVPSAAQGCTTECVHLLQTVPCLMLCERGWCCVAWVRVMLHASAVEPRGAAPAHTQSGMAEMSEAFRHKGAEVYLEPASLP